MMTMRAPMSNGTQTSYELWSNAGLATKATRSSLPISEYPLLMARRTMPRWATMTPLGRPVEPEVYMTYAVSRLDLADCSDLPMVPGDEQTCNEDEYSFPY